MGEDFKSVLYRQAVLVAEGKSPTLEDEQQLQESWQVVGQLLSTAGVTAKEMQDFGAKLAGDSSVEEKQELIQNFVTGLDIFSWPGTIRAFLGASRFVKKGERLDYIINLGQSVREGRAAM